MPSLGKLSCRTYSAAPPLLYVIIVAVLLLPYIICFPIQLSMADYLRGLFGAQKAPPPANEDGNPQIFLY